MMNCDERVRNRSWYILKYCLSVTFQRLKGRKIALRIPALRATIGPGTSRIRTRNATHTQGNKSTTVRVGGSRVHMSLEFCRCMMYKKTFATD